MITSNQINDLKLFNEKLAVLLNSSFANEMLRNTSGFMFSFKANEGYEAIMVGAEGESVDAAFLTLRMFMQDNDRLSVRNIAKIYSEVQDLVEFIEPIEDSHFDSPSQICFSSCFRMMLLKHCLFLQKSLIFVHNKLFSSSGGRFEKNSNALGNFISCVLFYFTDSLRT